MTAAPNLRVVTEDGELLDGCPTCQTLSDELAGYKATTDKQARHIGRLERDLKQYAQDEPGLPQNREALELGNRWKRGTGKTRAVIGAPRIKLIRARLKEYPMRLPDGEVGPSLELAIDGLCAFPFEAYGERYREDGPRRRRRDDLADALKDEKHVEKLARLGLEARERGWVTW